MPDYWSVNKCLVALNGMAAVVAFDCHVFAVGHLEPGFHRLIVGDTFRIAASHYSHDSIGKLHLSLLRHGIVADYVDFGVGRNQCYAVECRFRKEHVSDLDDSLLTETM